MINTASMVGLVGCKGHGVYASAKGGVIQPTKCTAIDYAEQGIRVNAICPGITWTGLVKQAAGLPVPPPSAPGGRLSAAGEA